MELKVGKVIIEIRALNPDKLINILWNNNINIYKVKKKNVSTIRLEVDYLNYEKVNEIVKDFGGKIAVVSTKGFIFEMRRIKKKISLAVGLGVFLGILFLLSNYLWAIDISVGKNITPFEIREQLKKIGIKPGIAKRKVVVEDIEKSLENLNSEILWLRVRIEGSTLNITIEEKINPPTTLNGEYGNLIANEDGEIKKIYTYAGRAVVKQEQMVKKGDVLIEGIDGKEGYEYIVPPRGKVVANTFHEKSMKVQLIGTKPERTGNIDKEIYVSIFGKKIYLKKATKDMQQYDRIEKSGKIFNEVIYYERKGKEINITEEEAEKIALQKLEETLKDELTRDAVIVERIVTKQLDGEENLIVKVDFIVEKNILNSIPVQY